MEEQKNHEHQTPMTSPVMNNGKTCTCGCGCGWANGHRGFRILLAVIIVIISFWLGAKVGEFKATFEDRMNSYDRYQMHSEYNQQMGHTMMTTGNMPMMPATTSSVAVPTQ